MSNINEKKEKVLTKMYISGLSFSDIAKKIKVDEDEVVQKVKELKLRVRPNNKQIEFETRLANIVRNYWEDIYHEVSIFQNEYGEVRSDLINGMPKYLKTSKYLTKEK